MFIMSYSLIVFDLDGTLANIDHRKHLIEGDHKDWDSFFKACSEDTPNQAVVDVLWALSRQGYAIHIVSSRSGAVMEETHTWLHDWDIYDYVQNIWMREPGDFRPDYVFKQEWLKAMITNGVSISMVFDDRDQSVDMWRANGIPCFQVAQGDF